MDRSPDGGETGSIPVRETPGSTPGTDTYSADSSELNLTNPRWRRSQSGVAGYPWTQKTGSF